MQRLQVEVHVDADDGGRITVLRNVLHVRLDVQSLQAPGAIVSILSQPNVSDRVVQSALPEGVLPEPCKLENVYVTPR